MDDHRAHNTHQQAPKAHDVGGNHGVTKHTVLTGDWPTPGQSLRVAAALKTRNA